MKKQFVTALVLALGISGTALAANPFSDVPAGHWAYAAVAKLAAAGIVDGYPDGTYKGCLLYTSPSPRDRQKSRMPSSA